MTAGEQRLQKEPAMLGPQPTDSSWVPGQPTSTTSSALNLGSAVLEKFAPLRRVCMHVSGFHPYAHDFSRQVEAHHYCSHLNEEVRQCVIYDSDAPDARLIGVEYMVSERLFNQLPEEEKKYWHSHKYEVSSGMLMCPNIPDLVERVDMQKVAFTYGKTWHMWQVDRGDPLPYGPPQLMMSFTADGQLDPKLLAARDERVGRSSGALRESRASLTYPDKVAPGADHWEHMGGLAYQTTMEKVPQKHSPAASPGGGTALKPEA